LYQPAVHDEIDDHTKRRGGLQAFYDILLFRE
jgi:hypothetical protein